MRKSFNLELKMDLIHNPTNEWMSCVLEGKGSKVCVSPIPPRSVRPVPSNLMNPQIYNENFLPQSAITKFSSSNAYITSSIVIEALELRIQGIWIGSFRLNDVTTEVQCHAYIKDQEVYGWFYINRIVYFLSGNLNPMSRNISYSLYNSKGNKYTEIRGSISTEENCYNIDGQSENIGFSLKIKQRDTKEIVEDEVISGKYLGFYERGPNSFKINATLTASADGIVIGTGSEEKRLFTLFGMVNSDTNKFFFIRLKGSETTYYNGDAQLQGEIFFQGHWHMGNHRGGISLIKCMP